MSRSSDSSRWLVLFRDCLGLDASRWLHSVCGSIAVRSSTCFLLWCCFLLVSACRDASDERSGAATSVDPNDPAEGPPSSLAEQRLLARAVFEETDNDDREWDEANVYDAVRPLVRSVLEHPDSVAQDFVNAAVVEVWDLEEGDLDAARVWVERAVEMDPRCAAAHFLLGHLATREHDWEAAENHFCRAQEFAPDDVTATMRLAKTLVNLDRREEAALQFQRVLDLGPKAGIHLLPAMYQLAMSLRYSKNEADRARVGDLLARHRSSQSDREEPDDIVFELGDLARVALPTPPPASSPPANRQLLEWTELARVEVEWGEPTDMQHADLDGDGDTDLVLATSTGVWLLWRTGEGELFPHAITEGPSDQVIASELLAGRHRHLVVRQRESCHLLIQESADRWHRRELPSLPPIHDVSAVDFDHDGDVDLALASEQGLALLRNDHGRLTASRPQAQEVVALDEPMHWTLISAEESGLPSMPLQRVHIEDLDSGNDVDFLVQARDGGWIACPSLRGGKFHWLTVEDTGIGCTRGDIALADIDGDRRVDVLAAEQGWFRGRGDGSFATSGETGAARVLRFPRTADLDGDGRLELLGLDGGRLVARFALPAIGAVESLLDRVDPAVSADSIDLFAVADLDRSAGFDLVTVSDTHCRLWCDADTDRTRFLRVELRGREDCESGLGATLECYASGHTQRRYFRGEPEVFGLGELGEWTVVRVLWPNGAVQSVWQETSPHTVSLYERPGGLGSCPFLYTFDGERWRFLTDVLGATPLGLPIAEGVFVQPDHDEWVRIPDGALQPVDGELLLRITEERREVTYLDRALLRVVDHPADTEVEPEERFCLPPFPRSQLHVLRDLEACPSVVDQDGRDWSSELATLDQVHAVPFQSLGEALSGIVTDHFLDLELPFSVRHAPRVRLVLGGWLEWMDATVNLAVDRHPDLALELPTLWVPEGHGWRAIEPPLGFPAGIDKTMVVDVGPWLVREDPRLRLTTNMQIYWDRIAVCTDPGVDRVREIVLEPSGAELFYHGFCARVPPARPDLPLRLDPSQRRVVPWNPMTGMVTRYGEVRPLLEEVDDCFVIFTSGDAVELRFDATNLPPLEPNHRRTYLLDIDGWAKDADFHTHTGGRVEPLPFHGMSGYPYGPDEHYPDDELHREYQQQWNTRRSAHWIGPKPELGAVAAEKPDSEP